MIMARGYSYVVKRDYGKTSKGIFPDMHTDWYGH